MARKNIILNILLILSIVAENFLLYISFRTYHYTQSVNAKALFLSSVLFGLILLYKFYKKDISYTVGASVSKLSYAMIGAFLLVLFFFASQYLPIFYKNPITPAVSDIIPEIQIACKRFLSGVNVYTPITDFGWTLQLTYLPMQWLPFTVAEIMHFDYRWIAFGIWAIAALILFARSLRTDSTIFRWVAGAIILLGNYVLFINNPGIVTSTVELMVAGYYMLLIIGLNQKNAIVLGLSISVCLLSRFSLLLWLPLGAFVMYVANQRKQLLVASITVLVVVLLVYVIPFLSKDWSSFYRGYKYYDISAYGEWKSFDENGQPHQLFCGTGFAYIFYYKLTHLDVLHRLKMLQKAHFIFSFGITIIMGIWYWFNRKKINHKIFLLSSFKIYLAVFLAFIQVPYEYLMIVGNFVSIAIFCEQLRYRVAPAPQALTITETT